jgi:hypothetical protein
MLPANVMELCRIHMWITNLTSETIYFDSGHRFELAMFIASDPAILTDIEKLYRCASYTGVRVWRKSLNISESFSYWIDENYIG